MSSENALAKVDIAIAALDQFIDSIKDAESADDALWQSRMMDDFLAKADACGEYASAFCLREAQILVKAASLPDHLEVKRRQKTIAWIRTKSLDEVQAILDECATGVRIGVIKARETRAANEKAGADRQLVELKRISDKVVTELLETGHTTNSAERFYSEWRLKDAPDKQAVTAFREKTKCDLIARGAVGLGDGSGSYANPVQCDRNETMLYVENRLRSMHNDMVSLIKHCRAAKFAVAASATDVLRKDLDDLEAPIDRH